MAYPSVITSFSNKVNGQVIDASDVNNVQTDVTAIETFIGTESSLVGTLFYDIRAAASGGGGHVQTANKGGTGQTSYNKGDLLVAGSSSVLNKLAVGTDGLALIADSTQSNGLNWTQVVANIPYAQDGGTSSVLAFYPSPAVTTLTAGQVFLGRIAATNTVVTPALSISSLVAKSITNINSSSVLIGQIPSSTLGMFGYDGTKFQYLNAFSSNFTNGVSSHDISTTGAQTIAHGLNSKPKKVLIWAFNTNTTSANNITSSEGTYNGLTTATNWSVCIVGSSPTFDRNTDTASIIVHRDTTDGTRHADAAITVDAINITLTWTKTGTPTGTIVFGWEAET